MHTPVSGGAGRLARPFLAALRRLAGVALPAAAPLLALAPLLGAAPPAADAPSGERAPDACGVRSLGEYPGGWVVGLASVPVKAGRTRAQAQEEAEAGARSDLRARVCAGMTDTDCGRLLQNAYPGQGSPSFDPDRRLVCAVYGVPRALAGDRTPSLRDAEAAIDGLARAVGDSLRASADPVAMDGVTTAEGCAVPDLAAVGQRVRNGLGVAFVEPGAARPEGRRLRLAAADAGATDLQLSADLVAPDGSFRTLHTTRFPRAAYGLAALPAGACRADAALGIPGGRRAGPGGLAVDLAVDTPADATPDSVCPGQSFTLSLATSAPARVHVYSVGPDGIAYHVWPEPAGSGRLTGAQSLGSFVASPLPGGGDERIVAVAVPEGAPNGPLDAHRGFCRVGAFVPPAGTAVDTATWRVDTRPGTCADAPAYPEEQLVAALAAAPDCPAP